MNFSQAMSCLRQGKKIQREGWNGKGMYLILRQGFYSWDPEDLETFPECIKKDYVEIDGEKLDAVEFEPSVCMKTSDNKIVVGWVASQTDMMADDWIEVNQHV